MKPTEFKTKDNKMILAEWFFLLHQQQKNFLLGFLFAFLIFFVPTATFASEIQVDANVFTTNTTGLPSSPGAVWIDANKAFVFYIGTEGDLEMASTTDGGLTWTIKNQVDSVNTTDVINYAIWWDGWTEPATTTEFIHVVTVDSGTDDSYYTRVNTQTGTTSTSVLATTQAGACTSGADCTASVTKAPNNVIFMAVTDGGDSWVVSCDSASTDCTNTANWSEVASAFGTTPDLGADYPFLMPIPGTNNILLTYWDVSATTIDYNIYSATSSSWASTSSITLASSKSLNTTYDAQLISMGLATSTGIIALALIDDANNYTTADHDINFYIYSSSTGWTTKTNPVTNDGGGLTGVKVSYDTRTNTWYVIYTKRSILGTGTTARIYYRTSNDDGTSWSTEYGPINDYEDDIYGLTAGLASGDKLGVWFNYSSAPRADQEFYSGIVNYGSTAISGKVYLDEGSTVLANPVTIKVAVGTSTVSLFQTTSATTTGDWSITLPQGHEVGATTTILAWVSGTTTKTSAFTKAVDRNHIFNRNLYWGRAIVGHEAYYGTAVTNTNLAFYDRDDDADIPYTATTSLLSVNSPTQLYIQAGKNFDPVGEVVVKGGTPTSPLDGSLYLATGASYRAGATTTLAGSFTASSSAIFDNDYALVLNATTTGKVISTTASTTSIGDVYITGTGGGYNFYTNATTTDLIVSSGATLVTSRQLTVNGNYTNNGTSTFDLAGINWTIGSSSEANSWTAVTYGNGQFVAVSRGGTNQVMTSPDGVTWRARAEAEANWWSSITYGGGKFVAVSWDGTNRVMYSTDGITWATSSATQANTWSSVTYGNGRFVAVSQDGTNRVMYSTDGITWATSSATQANTWMSITYGNGLFVAVASDGTNQVMTSSDGITWATSSASEANSWMSVTYGNGLFVAVSQDGTNQVMTSSDGISWTPQSASGSNVWFSVSYGNGMFIAVALGNEVMYSRDGINWTSVFVEGIGNLYSATYGEGKFVAVGQSLSRVMTSQASLITFLNTKTATATGEMVATSTFQNVEVAPVSTLWTARAEATANIWKSVTYGNGLFVAVSFNGTVMTAPDGITWTARTAAEANIWRSITYGNGLFVAVSSSGINRVMTSPDGITWISRSAAENNDGWSCVTYGNGQFVAVGYNGDDLVMTSPDGITWTRQIAGGTNSWRSVTYGNGLFVAVASDGTNRVMISPDGINWNSYSGSNDSSYWQSVTYGNGLFVAVAKNELDSVMTSPDGINWTTRFTDGNLKYWESITYGNGLFVKVSTDGYVMTSTNGINNWTNGTPSEANQWNSVTYGNGLFVAVAGNGTNQVMTSTQLLGKVVFTDNASTTNLTVGNGATLVAPEEISIAGDYYNDGIFTAGTGTTTFDGEELQILDGVLNSNNASSTSAFYNLNFTNVGPKRIDDALSVTNNFNIATTATVIASSTLYLNSNYHNDGNLQIGRNDTTQWATATLSVSGNVWTSVTYGNGLFVAVSTTTSTSTAVMTSPDGINWTTRSASAPNYWYDVTFGNGLFVAVACGIGSSCNNTAGGSRVMTSPDGITWTGRTAAAANRWVSVTYGNGLFVALSFDGTNQLMTSPDGITWTSRADTAANSWQDVAYGNGVYVAVSSDGTNRVMSSNDGITWTARSASVANSWQSVTYGNGLFVAVSATTSTSTAVMTSPDGVNWTARSASEAKSWVSVTYGNGLFVAVAQGTNKGTIMTSPDGINWQSSESLFDNTWLNVGFGDGKFVAVSSDGNYRIMTSPGELRSIYFQGSTTQSISGNLTATSTLPNLVFQNAGAKNFLNNASTTDFTIATSSGLVTAPTVLSVSGDFTNRSTFNDNSGTVILSGEDQTLLGTTTFYNLSKATTRPATTTFEAGALYTIENNFTFSGYSATNTHALRSTASGTQWKIDPQGTRTLSYLDVKDSNNINVTTISCGTGCIDGTNNTNWSFAGTGSDVLTSNDNYQFYVGQATTTLDTIMITSEATAANDIRLTIATTTSNFRFDTGTTNLTLTGTAAAKVSSTVTYEDGGATMVLNVTNNLSASDTFGVSGIKVGSFASVSTTTSNFTLHTDGNIAGAPAATDSKTIRITGRLAVEDHTLGQVGNEFNFQNKADEPIFAFNIEALSENATVTDMVVTLSGIQGIDSTNLSDFKLYRDNNSNQTLDGPDLLIDGSGILTINGQHGAVTFSTDFLASSSVNYYVTADINSVELGDSVVFKVLANAITAVGATSQYSPVISTGISSVQHYRGGSGAGGSSARVGDDAPAGAGVVGGGDEGGGDDGAGEEQDGANIAPDNEYIRPTSTGSPDNEWTNGSNALISDGTYTTAGNSNLKQSYAGFNFGIPTNNTIQGITVKLDASGSTAAGTIDVSISWDGGNSYTTAKATPTLSGSDIVYTVGGPSDTWGRSWGVSEFSTENFRLRVSAQVSSNTIRLDALEIRVFHQTGGGSAGGGGGI